MVIAIVTVRLPKNPEHDVHNKKVRACPLRENGGGMCSDGTGEHHSYIEEGSSPEEIKRKALQKYNHITRIEYPVHYHKYE